MVMFMEENASVRLCHQSTSSRRQTQSFLVIYPHVIRLINGYQKSSIDGDLDGKIKKSTKKGNTWWIIRQTMFDDTRRY